MDDKVATAGDNVMAVLGLLDVDEGVQMSLFDLDPREPKRKYDREWLQRPTSKVIRRINGANYRIRRGGGFVSSDEWALLKEKFDNCCAYCGVRTDKLEMEHIIPISRGGAHVPDNIVPACRQCNATKGARTPDEAGLALRTANK